MVRLLHTRQVEEDGLSRVRAQPLQLSPGDGSWLAREPPAQRVSGHEEYQQGAAWGREPLRALR